MPGGKPFQSKLAPFYDLIARLRKAHTPYPRIAQLLRKEHGLEVAASTIFEFVKVRARRSGVFALPERPGSAVSAPPSPVNEAHGTAQAAKTKARTKDAGGSQKSATAATPAAAAKKSTVPRPRRPDPAAQEFNDPLK